MSVRVPQRPSSALVGGTAASRSVGSILAESTVSGYVRRPRLIATAGGSRRPCPRSPSLRSEAHHSANVRSWRLSQSRRTCATARDEDIQEVRHALERRRTWSRQRTASVAPPGGRDRTSSQVAGASSTEPAQRQAPLSLHRHLFAGVLLWEGGNRLLNRIREESEALFVAAARAMAARLGLRVLREMDLYLLFLSIFHGVPVDETESRYLFKYLDYRGQGVIDLHELLRGLSSLYRPYRVTAALYCKRLMSGQLPGDSLVALDEVSCMLDGVADVLKEHPSVDAAALANAKRHISAQIEAIHLDYCVPAATACRLLKKHDSLVQALTFIDWSGSVVMPPNTQTELARLVEQGVRLQGAPAANRTCRKQLALARSRDNEAILDCLHGIYASTLQSDVERDASTERPIDATHPRFVADRYIDRSRAAPCVT